MWSAFDRMFTENEHLWIWSWESTYRFAGRLTPQIRPFDNYIHITQKRLVNRQKFSFASLPTGWILMSLLENYVDKLREVGHTYFVYKMFRIRKFSTIQLFYGCFSWPGLSRYFRPFCGFLVSAINRSVGAEFLNKFQSQAFWMILKKY